MLGFMVKQCIAMEIEQRKRIITMHMCAMRGEKEQTNERTNEHESTPVIHQSQICLTFSKWPIGAQRPLICIKATPMKRNAGSSAYHRI